MPELDWQVKVDHEPAHRRAEKALLESHLAKLKTALNEKMQLRDSQVKSTAAKGKKCMRVLYVLAGKERYNDIGAYLRNMSAVE